MYIKIHYFINVSCCFICLFFNCFFEFVSFFGFITTFDRFDISLTAILCYPFCYVTLYIFCLFKYIYYIFFDIFSLYLVLV